jgi:hypothetical protein
MPATAMATSSSPATTATSGRASGPRAATIGISTTVIAPVGPLTWKFDPPKNAATIPATIAVVTPTAGDTPVETANPSASGRATIATVTPATRSAPRYSRR